MVDISEVSKGYTAFEDGDLIWAKITPCMQNGKSAVARHLRNGMGFGSTEFHVIRVFDPEKISADYLWCILRLQPIREAAQRYFTGSAGQQRVPQDFLEGLVIPIPPKDVQDTIVAAVRARRQAVAEERKGIVRLKRALIQEAEAIMVNGVLP